MDPIDLRKIEIPPSVIARLSAAMARTLEAIPVCWADNVLTVAIPGTHNISVLDDLRFMLNCEVDGVVSNSEDVRWALDKYYSRTGAAMKSPDIQKILAGIMPGPVRLAKETELLKRLWERHPALKQLLRKYGGHWEYEDPVYRFYHQSFKVFKLQAGTEEIVAALKDLAPDLPLHSWFLEIVEAGTGKRFDWKKTNPDWTAITRPIVEAFFHARYFLEMACRYGRKFRKPQQSLPSGYAAFLYLYNLR